LNASESGFITGSAQTYAKSPSLLTRSQYFLTTALGYHLKTGHTLSVQNRPTELAEDVIVLPCFSVRLQGADSVVEAGLDI
jgi:hypothetical protein